MRAWVFGMLSVTAIAAPADGQIAVSPPVAYVVPPPVPEGGCVWDNAVFSNGAILERYLGRSFYIRCMSGRWQSFYSYHDATMARDEPPSPMRSSGQRPMPLR
jgi:hypothetical protein